MKEKKLTLLFTLLLVGFLPLITIAVLLNVYSALAQKRTLEENAYSRLEAAANGLRMYYEWDIVNADGAAYEHDYVDSLKGQDIELTLFLGDTRYITSITDEKGERTEGTQMDPAIYKVVSAGNDHEVSGVVIGGSKYYGYYVPVKDGSGTVVGAAFAGEPQTAVKAEIRRGILYSTGITLIGVVVFGLIIIFVAKLIKSRLMNVVNATATIAEGDMSGEEELSSSIYEINYLGLSLMSLRQNMRNVLRSVLDNIQVFDEDMSKIMESVDVCNNASDEITKAVDDLAQGSVTMSEDIAGTSESMKVIGDEIQRIHTLAEDANVASGEVQRESDAAKEKIGVLMDANKKTIEISNDVVNGIQASSEAVEKIQAATEMITSITSQTALLSLNASIEAARAGEAGKGFAVVASEISNLANQSDQSTKEIQDIVTEIIKSSEQNVELSNRIKEAIDNEGAVLAQVRDSFQTMTGKISENTEAIGDISNKVVELSGEKDKVLDAVAGLSSVSEENAASCEETNASMEEMGATVANIHEQSSNTMEACATLREICGYFKI
ncbi:MAG: cache domain-containing protein [Lachnospiraceae bacterium]|nr:cache domain-containing protein [Lachnospiraceae bacterium]